MEKKQHPKIWHEEENERDEAIKTNTKTMSRQTSRNVHIAYPSHPFEQKIYTKTS